MTSTLRNIAQPKLRDKFFIHNDPIPVAGSDTWFSIYNTDRNTVTILSSGGTPPNESVIWFDPGRIYLLKDMGSTIYQKGITNRIFRYVQWTSPDTKESYTGIICVHPASGEKSPFLRHG